MAITKEQKKVMLAEFDDILATSASCTFVKFQGLSGEDTTRMRAQLRGEGVGYKVVKKTLLVRSLENASVTGNIPELEGNIALAYSKEDATASAREIYNFAQDFKDNLSIVGGIFEQTLRDASGMQEIATIPSLDVLRGMLANVINSPIQGLAIALSAVADQKE